MQSKHENLTVCPFRWEVQDESSIWSNGYMKFLVWCHKLDNEPTLIIIKDYAISIYFVFPDNYEGVSLSEWDINDAKSLHSSLVKIMQDNGKYVMPFNDEEDFCTRRTLYYYQENERPMCKLSFKNGEAMRHAKNLLNKGIFIKSRYGGKVHGEVLLFEIDAVRKLLTSLNTVHCGWLECTGRIVTNPNTKISTSKTEYIVRHKTIVPIVNETVPRPLWCSYDIEVYSHNHKAFPNEWFPEDKIYLITMVFFRDGEPRENWKVIAVLYGKCIIEDEYVKNNLRLIIADSEMDLIDKFAEVIRELDPDLLTGYNILQFDNKYIENRLAAKARMTWPVIGRLKSSTGKTYNSSWKSNAFKEKDLYIPHCPGRSFIDFFEHAIRTYHWDTYSLDNAAKQLLKNDKSLRKKDVPPEMQFSIYKEMRLSLRHENDFMNKKHTMDRSIQAVKRDYKELPDVITQEKVQNKVTEVENRKKPKWSEERVTTALKEMGRLVVYGVYDSLLVAHIASKIHWWIGIREMCNVVGVPPDQLLTRGLQARVLSLLYDSAIKNRIILDTRQSKPFYYEGGMVQVPDRGMHIAAFVLDFKSLYPSLIIRYNLCYTTLIAPPEHNKYADLPQLKAVVPICDEDINDDDDELVEEKKKIKREDAEFRDGDFRFIDKKVKEGLFPMILRKLLEARAEVRGRKTDDPTLKIVYEGRQLALKLCANAAYGFTGVKKGAKRSCLEIAATTTFYGRKSIKDAITWTKENYDCNLAYGDTDSYMMTLPSVPLKDKWRVSVEIARRATELFEKPLEFEMEGLFDLFCVKAKHYGKTTYISPDRQTGEFSGKLIMSKTDPNMPEITVKGLTPARRDNCQWVRDVIYKILQLIMTGKKYYQIIKYFHTEVTKLFDGNVDLDDLVLTKGLGSGYKNDSTPMKVFSEEMAKAGKPMSPGERHKFIVVSYPGVTKIGLKMMLLSLYTALPENERPPLDFKYYFNNLLMKKVDVLIAAQFEKHNKVLRKVKLKWRGRTTTGETPSKLLGKMIDLNMDLDDYLKCMIVVRI